MANRTNDDRDRIGNRSTPPQGSTQGIDPQGRSRNPQDPVNRDREMNRDRDLGQGSSGSDTSRNRGRGPSDFEEE